MKYNDLIDDLRSRINPAFEDMLGTESYERRLCVEALEALLAEREELRDEIAKLSVEVDRMEALCDMNYAAGVSTGWNYGVTGDTAARDKVIEGNCRPARKRLLELKKVESCLPSFKG